MKQQMMRVTVAMLMLALVERATAAEFEKVGSAIGNALGTKLVFQKKMKNAAGADMTVYFSKNASGNPAKVAFVEKGLYNPGACTHTWVISLEYATQTVSDVRVVEMSCTHAHPTRAASYTAQYKGKGPAQVSKLKEQIKTIAKATGSSDLMTEAVQRSITNATAVAGKL